MKIFTSKKYFYVPMFAALTTKFFDKQEKLVYMHKENTIKLDRTINKHLQNELSFHISNFEHYINHLIKKEQIIFRFEQNEAENQIQIRKTLDNYKFNKEVRKLSKEVKKIDKNLKSYINLLENKLNSHNILTDIEFDVILDELKKISKLKKKLENSFESSKENLNSLIINFIFNEHEEVVLRLLSLLVIFNKNSEVPLINEEYYDYIVKYCQDKINNNSHFNESHKYFAQRVLINMASRSNYFYQDFSLEINHNENLQQFTTEKFHKVIIKDDTFYDYDIIFLSGLNASFSKSWRIPEDEFTNANLNERVDYLLYGKHIEKIYSIPSYKLWIPKMFENVTFSDKRIRYLVSCAETKFFPCDLEKLNIPDFSIDQISERIYNSLKNAGVGKRPVIFICHSMGGLICKRILQKAKQEGTNKLLPEVKGIVFFSTPHLGSSIIHTLLDVGIKKYIKHFKLFETTSTEYGLDEDEIHAKLSDYNFTKATKEICFSPKEIFAKEHEEFKKLGIKYICINETNKTFIKAFGRYVHIVEPESNYLPETENYLLKNKLHSNLQKFHPNNFNDEGYAILVDFIINNFALKKSKN
jgi:hypothetical protein